MAVGTRTVLALLGGVVLTGAVAAAGVVTLGVIGHPLFVNAPVEDVASPSRVD